ncbi:gustatory receptor for sugar taste 61a-like [Daktulosphaira vitifoliae]|uniref:gustatory receptor for sugar taste 61a-like n=1 Tax=Daktulosphaira vitifoliae TaxID=58002 RepID=UPI0021A98B92|nr:gustatory receptor for sugar taste 61a-like [Daktulosphaira vitifoliae]
MALFINLSAKWCNLLEKWEQVEGYFGHQKYLKMKFTFISVLFLIFSMVEHWSFLLTSLIMTDKVDFHEVFEMCISNMFPQVFSVVQYNVWIAILTLIINSVSTLSYCFADQVIIMGSMALGDYLKLFTERLNEYRGKVITPKQWKTLRVDYTRLCSLARTLDDCLCHLLCVSLLIHLYIICLEMRQGVTKSDQYPNISKDVHTILSFSVSTLRACSLCLSSVRIYENSKGPLETLYNIPQQSYCKEVELFMLQMQKDDIGLTGSHMFLMTRKFLLTVRIF